MTKPKEDRSQWLGGSDAAAVMGLSPYATPVELWQEKTGRKPPAQPDQTALRRWARGHKLEPFIREMVVARLQDEGLQVELLATNQRYVDEEHAFLSCEIDFELKLTGTMLIGEELVSFDGEHINADAKSVSGFARNKWGVEHTEDVPIEYAAQFMFGLMVTGRSYCLVAALRGFDDVDIYWTIRDQETIDAMRQKLVDFWIDHVQGGVPPDPIKFDDIKALFPLDNGLAIAADADIADAVDSLRGIRREIKNLEDDAERLSLQIGEFISPNSRLTYGGADIATWKAQGRRGIDTTALRAEHPDIAEAFTKTTTFRVLRLPQPKGSA